MQKVKKKIYIYIYNNRKQNEIQKNLKQNKQKQITTKKKANRDTWFCPE